MNSNTTLGKTVKTLAWVAATNAVVAVLTYVTGHQELYNPMWVSLANVALVTVKNLADPNTKNI